MHYIQRWLEENKNHISRTVNVAWPAVLESFFVAFVGIVDSMMVSMMAAKLGTRAFAALQVGMNVMSLSFSFGDGMQVAAVTLIGQSLGQKDAELAKRYGTICQRMGNVISVFLSVLYLLLGRWFFSMFFEEPETIQIGVEIMRVMVLIVLLQVAQVIYMGCLRGAGDVRSNHQAAAYPLALPLGKMDGDKNINRNYKIAVDTADCEDV